MLAQLPPWASAGLVVFFLFICVLLILTVLIQRPAGGGLSGAFGSGAGSGQTAFGAKTGDALTIATIAMFVVYILFAIGLNYATRPAGTGGGGATVAAPTTPAESTAPAPAVPPQPAELGPIPGSSQSGPNTDGTPTTTPPSPAPGDQPVTTPPATPPAGEPPAAPPSQPQEPSAQPPAPGTPPPAEPAPQPAPGR